MNTQTETASLVCLQHDRYWPCKELAPGEREHWWAHYTIWTAYAERRDGGGTPLKEPE